MFLGLIFGCKLDRLKLRHNARHIGPRDIGLPMIFNNYIKIVTFMLEILIAEGEGLLSFRVWICHKNNKAMIRACGILCNSYSLRYNANQPFPAMDLSSHL